MNEKQLLKEKVLYYFKIYRSKLLLLYLVTILSNLIALIPLYLFGTSLDFVISGNFNSVIRMIVIMIIIFFITTLLSIVETILHRYITQLITIDSKNRVYEKILNLKRKDFNGINNGELLSKLENDSIAMANFITEDIIQIVISFVTLFITLLIIIKISLKLSIIAMITFPTAMIITNIFSKRTRKFILKGKKLQDENVSVIQETLVAIEEIKCLSMEKYLIDKYELGLNNLMKNDIKTSLITTVINVLSRIITSIGEWIIILVSAWMIIHNMLTIGTLVSFNSFCAKFTVSITTLTGVNVKVQSVYLSIRRIEELLNLSDENEFKTNYNPKLYGEVTMKEINFSYDSNIQILNGLNLKIKPKSLYVIVGKNGCGKTSLLNLLLRFFEGESGDILFDDNNIKNIDINYLRTQICYIPQQPFIFQGTINDNLSIDNNLTIEDKINVCKLVGIHSFIEKLPHKYDMIIGKNGIKLSGGQKQKLAIARGILRNPKIMILDEITSDLDSKSELEIMDLLNRLSEKFTIITVAHRISSILSCPNIIVMKEGKIASQGTHNELISNCKPYIDLYKSQLENIKEKSLV